MAQLMIQSKARSRDANTPLSGSMPAVPTTHKRTRQIPREVIAYIGVSSCSIMDSRFMRHVREWQCLLGWRAVLEVCGDSGRCTSIRYISTRYTPIKYTPMRYRPMRYRPHEVRCASIRYTLMGYKSSRKHAHKVHAHEIHAYRITLVNIISRGLCIS
jgi:hypothetical protein